MGRTDDGHKLIREGSDEAILRQNDMDEALFRFGEELFEEQVRISQSGAQKSFGEEGAGIDGALREMSMTLGDG